MIKRIDINNEIFMWAISRAGYELNTFSEKFPLIKKWLNKEAKPTIKQLETFSKKVYIPFGYLFLEKPPKEKLTIPYFRTNDDTGKLNINVFETILTLQKRQDWLKNFLLDNEVAPLRFVGRFKGNYNVTEIVKDIRKELNLAENWANQFKTWEQALKHLIQIIEDKRIVLSFNSIVDNNTHRKLPIDECRGFVLVDKIVPFMFINSADFKSAQMFTIIHELVHIWTGHSAGFDFRKLQPANNKIERLCNQVAAEFLVPQKTFNKIWEKNQNLSELSHYFKVSKIVIARRALDTKKWDKKQFFNFYDQYSKQKLKQKASKSSGGKFYPTVEKRLSKTFINYVYQAMKSGKILYRDACKLTAMKGDTLERFLTKHYKQ